MTSIPSAEYADAHATLYSLGSLSYWARYFHYHLLISMFLKLFLYQNPFMAGVLIIEVQ